MPKNTGKGGKAHRKGKKPTEGEKRELEFKQDGMEYGQVIKVMGGGRFEILGNDGTKRLGHVRGKMFKRVWINTGDVVLVSLRDYQDGKCDIMMKYNPDEIRSLKAYGELSGLSIDERDENSDIDFAPKSAVGKHECGPDCQCELHSSESGSDSDE